MRFNLGYPILAIDPPAALLTAPAIATIAAAAEAAGFDSIALTEHPAPPDPWRAGPGHDALDPFVGLAVAAGAASRIRLLTSITVVPYRNPFLLAKTAATLDVISGGRLILGTGTGFLREEYQALGVDFEQRNALFDEALEVLLLAWGGRPVNYQGIHFQASATVSHPTPVQSPHPPIWIGGNAALTRCRVARVADGWMPIPTRGAAVARRRTPELDTLKQLASMIAEIRTARDGFGRPDPLDVTFTVEGVDPFTEPERYLDRLGELEQIGVTWVGGPIGGTTVAQVTDRVAEFGQLIISASRR